MIGRITQRADADVEAICRYIAQDNPDAADKLDARLHEEMRKLVRMPGVGHRRADVTNARYRFWSVGKYVIAYRVEKTTVVISRVIHGARDFRKLFRP